MCLVQEKGEFIVKHSVHNKAMDVLFFKSFLFQCCAAMECHTKTPQLSNRQIENAEKFRPIASEEKGVRGGDCEVL